MKVDIVFYCLFLLVLNLFMPHPANAADGHGTKELTLEPVVVTAEKRAEEAQRVPTSMTVLDREDIEDMNITGTGDIAEYVPNMEFKDYGSRRHGLLFMRGIKSLPGGQSGTGFSVDGLNYSKAYMFMGFPIFDVDRIEVLRGAQGTLYGRNTTGGVINFYTAEPGDEFVSKAGTTFGNYGKKEVRASCSGPLVEDRWFLGLYAVGGVEDSYMKNDIEADGERDPYKQGMDGRVKLRYEASDAWKTNLTLEMHDHEDGAFPLKRTERNAYVKAGTYSADGRYRYSHDFGSTEDVTLTTVNLNSELDTGVGTLNSVTGYQVYNGDEWIDADMSPQDAMRKQYRQQDNDLSQEFRLTSPENGGPLKWISGTYLFHFNGKNKIDNHLGVNSATPGTVHSFDTSIYNSGAALFGEGTYTFFQALDLTLGFRGEYERVQGKSSWTSVNAGGVSTLHNSYNKTNEYKSLLPKLSVAYHFGDDVMTYASVAKAHKSGGFNAAFVSSGDESYDEEKSWLYELGVKSYLFDRRLMLNLAGFYTSIDQEQLPLFKTGTTQGYLANAGKSHRTGVEMEGQYLLAEAWTLRGSGSWIDARFDEYQDTNNGIDYSGDRVFCIPEYTYSLALDYRDRIGDDWAVFGRAGVSGFGPQYFDNANTVKQEAYQLVDLRLGFQWKDLECSFWAKNVFDRYYVVFENTTAGCAEDGRPRTLGVSLDYTF